MTEMDSEVIAPDVLLPVDEQPQQIDQPVKPFEEEKVQDAPPADSEDSADDSSAVIEVRDKVEECKEKSTQPLEYDMEDATEQDEVQQLERPVKPVEEEKVQDEPSAGNEDSTDDVTAVTEARDQSEEHREESALPIEHAAEEMKEQDEQAQPKQQLPEPNSSTESPSDLPTLLIPLTASDQPDDQPTHDSPLPPPEPTATIEQDNNVDNGDSDEETEPSVPAIATSTAPASSTIAVPRPNHRSSILEQQIELEEKHDREYHVPHLADFDFSTPTPSEPATPVPVPSTPPPFQFDPSIILLPDTERFRAASLPLLYPKLALTLSRADVSVDIKLSALACCVELSRSPLHVYELQAHGVLDELIVNTGAGDEQLRVLATEALTWAVRQREARHYCRENGVVGRMGTLLIDHSVSVRLNAASVLLRLSASEPKLLYEPPVSAAAGDAASVMAYLVRRVERDSSDAVKALLLRCILCGLKSREGLIVARYNTLLPALTSLLPYSHPSLIAAACDCLAAVAVEEVDRQELLSLGLHNSLLQWLAADDVTVRRSAAGALMQATVGVAVKQAVVAAGGVQLCAQRIKSEEAVEAVLCVQLELLANLMESKQGKQQVAGDLALLTAVRSRADDQTATHNLRLSAQSALQKLLYQP